MILFLICCTLMGISLLYIFKINKLSKFILFSLPLGIAINTIIFTLLAIFRVLYRKEFFFILTFISFCFLIYQILKNKIKIENDLKKIPFWYIIFILYVLIKLIIMAYTSYFDFYNFDEFTAYTKFSKVLFESKDFSIMVNPFSTLMYFIGTMVFDIMGSFNMSIVRVITPIYFVLISFFLYQTLRENKVNRHIAALIASLFLVSSSENLVLAKTFYTNVIFSFYEVSGIYLLLKNSLEKEEKKSIILACFLLITGALTRGEGKYIFIGISLFVLIMKTLKNRKINKKSLLLFISSLIIVSGINTVNRMMIPTTETNTSNSVIETKKEDTLKYIISEKLAPSNLETYFHNLYNQTFEKDYYYYNHFAFLCLILSIIIYILYLMKNKGNRLYNYKNGIIFVEVLYLAIILSAQLVLFSIREFRLAASFSRYVLSFIPLNFLLCGICLFENTDGKKEIIKKEPMKIKKTKVLLIIPAYNEEKNILKTYNSIIEYNSKNKENYDVIVINDGSTDNTKKILVENNIPHISLINNLGIGGAVQTGYLYALKNNYDIAIQFDGDGQHDIGCIKKIINPIVQGEADLVIGSRFIEKDKKSFNSTFARRIGISLISMVIKYFSEYKIYDTTSGFRACNKEIIKKWAKAYPDEYPEPITNFEILKEGYIIQEIPVIMKERKEGKSSIHTWKNFYYMINVVLTIIVINMRRK